MADVPVTSSAPTTTPAAPPPPSSPAPSIPSAPTTVAGEIAAVRKELAAAGSPPAAPRETTPPAKPATQADASAVPPADSGHIPLDRHKAVLTQARNEADQKIAEIKRQFAWAENLTPQQVERGMSLINWLTVDPKSAIEFLQAQHARTQPAAPEPMPEPDVVLADGSKFFSADAAQRYADHREKQLEARLEGKYGPVMQRLALRELKEQTDAEAVQYRDYYQKALPQFTALENEIKDLCLKHPDLTIEQAWAIAYNQKGRAMDHQAWLAEQTKTATQDPAGRLQTKVAASSVAPGVPHPVTPKADKDMTTKEIIRSVRASLR